MKKLENNIFNLDDISELGKQEILINVEGEQDVYSINSNMFIPKTNASTSYYSTNKIKLPYKVKILE